jgi:hypothetical protein
MVDLNNNSGSYNGSTPGSEPDNEAERNGISISKWSEDDDDMGIITPFLGRGR